MCLCVDRFMYLMTRDDECACVNSLLPLPREQKEIRSVSMESERSVVQTYTSAHKLARK